MLKSQNKWPVSVCSWSLQCKTEELIDIYTDLGSPQTHLALGDLLNSPEKAEDLAQKLSISATMIGFPQEDYTTLETIKASGGILPDDCWNANLETIRKAIELTNKLNVPFLTFHAGFIDETDPVALEKMTERIQTVADIAADNGITILLETGQESAADLKSFMQQINHAALGVNFDPANMILYDKGNPIEAIKLLAPWIKHIHIKDATKSPVKGEWGAEVPWAEGEVGAEIFIDTLSEINYSGSIAIEREAGETRIKDIKSAINKLIQ